MQLPEGCSPQKRGEQLFSGFWDSLCTLWFFNLLADCDTFASPYQLGEICVEGVMWEACEIDFFVLAIGASG